MEQLQVKLSYVPSVPNAAQCTEDRTATLPAETKMWSKVDGIIQMKPSLVQDQGERDDKE